MTRAGYAVMRVDDRGVGGTGGVPADATYGDLAGDVAAGLAFLRSRPDINADAVGLLGHREGGHLAPLVAQARAEKPDFVILTAGPAVTGKAVLIEQNELIMTSAGASAQEIVDQVAFVTRYADLIIAGDFTGANDLARARVPEAGGSADLAPDTANDAVPAVRRSGAGPASADRSGARRLRWPGSAGAARAERAGAAAAAGREPGRHGADLPEPEPPAAAGHHRPADEYSTIETTIDPAVLDLYVSWLQQRFPGG